MTYGGATFGGTTYAGSAPNAQTTTETVTISADSAVETTDTVTRRKSVTLSGTGTVSTTASIKVTSVITGAGSVTTTESDTATSAIAGASAITATGTVTSNANSTINGVGSTTATGSVTSNANSTISGVGATASTGTVTSSGSSTISGMGATASTGTTTVTDQSAISATAGTTAIGTITVRDQSTINASATTTVTGTITIPDQTTTGTINTWGQGLWGSGIWGTQLALESEQLDILLDNWPFDQIYPSQSDAAYEHLLTIEQALNRLNARITEVSAESRIDTATDERLNALVGEINLTRETGESNERLQFRGTANKVVGRSQGTVRDFETVLVLIFGDDVVSGFDISSPSSEPIVQLTVPPSAINEIPLTQSELEAILEDAIPHADTLRLLTDDTFIFGESDKQGLGKGKLI